MGKQTDRKCRCTALKESREKRGINPVVKNGILCYVLFMVQHLWVFAEHVKMTSFWIQPATKALLSVKDNVTRGSHLSPDASQFMKSSAPH